jgi:multisubunit Na+/H+ antiporter MnhB subunit
MQLHFTGIIIAASTFLIIGLCHPLVIKQEYYTGTRYWWVYLLIGIACVSAAFFIPNFFESERTGIILSSILGVMGASFLWGIGELFSQKKRVERGWFPMNPKRKHEYKRSGE